MVFRATMTGSTWSTLKSAGPIGSTDDQLGFSIDTASPGRVVAGALYRTASSGTTKAGGVLTIDIS